MGFPSGSDSKESAHHTGHLGSILGSGRPLEKVPLKCGTLVKDKAKVSVRQRIELHMQQT